MLKIQYIYIYIHKMRQHKTNGKLDVYARMRLQIPVEHATMVYAYTYLYKRVPVNI